VNSKTIDGRTYDTNPLKAIRRNCIECSGGNTAEVAMCVIKHCPLYPYRFGKNPFHGRAGGKLWAKVFCEDSGE